MARRARVSRAAFFRSRSADGDRGGSHGDSEPLVDPPPQPSPKTRGREYLLSRTHDRWSSMVVVEHADRRVGWRAARRSARAGRGAHTMARRARVSRAAFFRSRSAEWRQRRFSRRFRTACRPPPQPSPKTRGREYLLSRTHDRWSSMVVVEHADRRAGWRAARRSARTRRGADTVARRARVSRAAFFRSRSADGDRGGSRRDSEPLVDPHPNPPPKHGGGSMNLPRVGGHSGQVQREYLLCRTLPGSGSSGQGSCPNRRCALRLVCRRWTRDLIELL